jgi:hypothetical protein
MGEVGRKHNELIGGDLSMKMNIAGVEYEGSPQELKELFDLLSDNEAEESKEEYRKVVRSPREGDYVKFNESDDDDITVGKYYEITAIDDDGDAVFIDDGGSVNWALKALFDEGEFEFFEKVAQNAIFTKLGRKPNEFKKGDIVRVISTGSSNHKRGDIGEITEFSRRSHFRVKTASIDSVNWVNATDVKLIAPVESRVDI